MLILRDRLRRGCGLRRRWSSIRHHPHSLALHLGLLLLRLNLRHRSWGRRYRLDWEWLRRRHSPTNGHPRDYGALLVRLLAALVELRRIGWRHFAFSGGGHVHVRSRFICAFSQAPTSLRSDSCTLMNACHSASMFACAFL